MNQANAYHNGHAMNGENCYECGSPFREQERIVEVWSRLFGKMVGKKHRDFRSCEKVLYNRNRSSNPSHAGGFVAEKEK